MIIAKKSLQFVVTVFLLLVITNQALGCGANCTHNGETWRCSSSHPGNPYIESWSFCESQGDAGCLLSGYCAPLVTQLRRKVIIDEKIILDVANQQPRLAMALLTFRRVGPTFNKTRIFSPAIKVSTSDVKRALANDAFGRDWNGSPEKPTVYDISWRDGFDPRTATLVLTVVGPSTEGLQSHHFEIEFVKTDIRSPALPTFRATNWQLVREPAHYQLAGFLRSPEIDLRWPLSNF